MNRNLFTLKLTIKILIVCCVMNSSSFSTAGERILIEGFVNAIKSSTGGTSVIALTSKEKGEIYYYIHLDRKGKQLFKEMEGKLVEIIADINVRDGETWLEVKSYKEIKNGLNK